MLTNDVLNSRNVYYLKQRLFRKEGPPPALHIKCIVKPISVLFAIVSAVSYISVLLKGGFVPGFIGQEIRAVFYCSIIL